MSFMRSPYIPKIPPFRFKSSGKTIFETLVYGPDAVTGNKKLGPLGFGGGYAAGTYIFFPGNYTKSSYSSKSKTVYMPGYGNSYGYSNRYYSKKKIRVWSKKYRKYIWVYPRRRY